MANDIFNAKGTTGGVFKGTTVAITLGAAGGGNGQASKGSLVQNISISYNRGLNRIWELGSDDTYFILGHTEGSIQMSRIIGRKDSDIVDQLGDACKAKDMVLNISSTDRGEACPGSEMSFSLQASGPMLQSVAFSISADNFLANSNVTMMISGLSKSSR